MNNPVVSDTSHRSRGVGMVKNFHHYLHAYPYLSPLIVVVLCIVLFGLIVGSRFLHPFNLSLIVQQVTIIGILGVAQSLVILSAGIDLSVGSIMVLSSVVMGRLAVLAGVPTLLAFLIGLLIGSLCGLINGLLVVKIKLPPFIVTLGTWNIFFALNLWYSRSEDDSFAGCGSDCAVFTVHGTVVRFSGSTADAWRRLHDSAVSAVWLYSQMDSVRTTSLRDRWTMSTQRNWSVFVPGAP